MAEARYRALRLADGSRVLQFASLSFDASMCEILMAVRAGAALCLAPRESILPGPALIQLLREQAISAVLLPPWPWCCCPRSRSRRCERRGQRGGVHGG